MRFCTVESKTKLKLLLIYSLLIKTYSAPPCLLSLLKETIDVFKLCYKQQYYTVITQPSFHEVDSSEPRALWEV